MFQRGSGYNDPGAMPGLGYCYTYRRLFASKYVGHLVLLLIVLTL